ncbi:AbrB/MazE/SpoVT family DNA-binding domain-containing protein [Candidatus Uhrbacteria bacterium]|nr:AbrB/MazE/SpoVT family DNA-binding domain-containing protein [Candidatus Uhrbacteria bacterium]
MKISFNPDEHLLGSTVMGERGQVVIPKEFRDKMGLESGSRLVVMQHGDGPVCLVKAEEMKDFVKAMYDKVNSVLEK